LTLNQRVQGSSPCAPTTEMQRGFAIFELAERLDYHAGAHRGSTKTRKCRSREKSGDTTSGLTASSVKRR
jgi:hypothetical protein